MGSLGQPQFGIAEERFGALYRRHFGFVWSLTAHFGVPAGAREDVAQEVWFAVHRRLDALRPEASTRAWVASITRNVALHHHRAHSRRTRKHAALVAVTDVVEHPRPADAIAVLDAALRGLEPAQREVFLLIGVEELTGPEAAEILGVPLNTVYSRLRLARARLAAVVADPNDDTVLEQLRVHRPQRASQRVWLALAADLGLRDAAPGVLGSLFAGKLATVVGTMAATTIATLTLGVVTGAGAQPPASHATVAIETRAGRGDPDGPAVSDRAEVRVPAELGPGVSSASAASPPPVPRVEPDRSRPSPRTRRSGGVVGPSVAPPPTTATPSSAASTLAAEAALLGAARRALAEGDPARARTLLDRHAASFPDGALAADRRAASSRVSCALGERDLCSDPATDPIVAVSMHGRDGKHGGRESSDEE